MDLNLIELADYEDLASSTKAELKHMLSALMQKLKAGKTFKYFRLVL